MSRQRRERARARAAAVSGAGEGLSPPTPARSWWSRRGRWVALVLLVGAGGYGLLWFVNRATPPEVGTAESVTEGASGREIPPTKVAARPAPPTVPPGMVWIPGGTFPMGCDDPNMADANHWHSVTVSPFWIDRTEVTNAEFERFVEATGHLTSAEKALDPREFPGVPATELAPASLVFAQTTGPVPLDNHLQWWRLIHGADWRHPEGPGSDLKGRDNHPVVQVSWDDAVAYAKWAGKRLPTEAEWEFAARGGLDRKEFTWGDEFRPLGKIMANTWQGRFPAQNTAEDGFRSTSPVGTFPPNGFGLVDMAGNVWEWCSDWYRPDTYLKSPSRNPTGPSDSYDPNEPDRPKRVQRGGSFLCNDQYCKRYDPGGRGKGDPTSGACHVGFRCVLPAP